MTTSNSPMEAIRAQAIRIVSELKNGRMQRKADRIKFAVAMDDKTLSITWPWRLIDNSSHNDLANILIAKMTEGRTVR